ncbi:MAG: helix-turn-helix domain-containing protein [Cyanobacteria bacterium P01_A01_bin.83]
MVDRGKYLTPFQRKLLEKSLQTKDLRSEYQCRIKIMLLADEGLTKTKISEKLKCTAETARYWMGQARAGQAHNWQDCPRGRPKTINDEYIALLRKLVKSSPREYGYPFKRWTGRWLSKHLKKELDIELSSRHVNRLLNKMGLSTRAKSISHNSLDSSSTDSSITLRELSATDTHTSSSPEWQLNFFN